MFRAIELAEFVVIRKGDLPPRIRWTLPPAGQERLVAVGARARLGVGRFLAVVGRRPERGDRR